MGGKAKQDLVPFGGILPPSPPRKRSHRIRYFPVAVAGFLALSSVLIFMWFYRDANRTIRVGPRTTYFPGPLLPDGTVNYVAAYNIMAGKGVTAHNNAAIPLIRLFRPSPSRLGKHWRLVLKEMHYTPGKGPEPEFMPFQKYLRLHPVAKKLQTAGGLPLTMGRAVRAHMHPWRQSDDPALARYLHSQMGAFAALRRAVRRRQLFLPASGHHADIGPVGNLLLCCRSIGRALTARATLDLGRHHVRRALGDLRAAQRLGALMGQTPSMIYGLIGQHIARRAMRAELFLVTRPKAGISLALFKAIAAHRCRRPLWSCPHEFDTGQRLQLLAFVTEMYRVAQGESRKPLRGAFPKFGPSLLTDMVNWNSVLRRCNRMMNAIVRAQKLKSLVAALRVRQFESRHEFKLRYLRPPEAYLHSTRMMFTLIARMRASTHAAEIIATNGHMQPRILRVAVALAIYHAKTRTFPASLRDLAPQYIKKIPSDLFTGQPLIYHRVHTGYFLTCGWKQVTESLKRATASGLVVRYPAP